MQYEEMQVPGGVPVKSWTQGVPVDEKARQQLRSTAMLPFVHRWVAAMPDVHLGIGATVGSVVPTRGAIIPAAVGVDIGCGMVAACTDLTADDLPDHLAGVRSAIEKAVPHGRTPTRRGRGSWVDRGSWHDLPEHNGRVWREQLQAGFAQVCASHPAIAKSNNAHHLGTLGTGNHFIEVCLDEVNRVWIMLHSGSRGVGNKIGSHFIALAQRDMADQLGALPNKDLAYFEEGSAHFDDYVHAVGWAQDFARLNRELMLRATIIAMTKELGAFRADLVAVNCHHNYVAKEHHFGADVWVTRKGAVRAGLGELGIIPGSMGARSYIVRGKGNADSFCSCSHGAGRVMSRTEARKRFTVADQVAQTAGVECRKDADVIDEIPAAYKPIEAVMAAQSDLVDVVHTLHQVVCVKG
ncbi:MAG: RtcB family protein [Deltaproteobacteria bacterium]|nr:RtcB family protein [Deltaproteobacteria bacterium]